MLLEMISSTSLGSCALHLTRRPSILEENIDKLAITKPLDTKAILLLIREVKRRPWK